MDALQFVVTWLSGSYVIYKVTWSLLKWYHINRLYRFVYKVQKEK